ncbi:unnamed protein product [Penicillium manginii]
MSTSTLTTAPVYGGICGKGTATYSSVKATAALIMLVTAALESRSDCDSDSDSDSVWNSSGSSLATKTANAVSADDKAAPGAGISFGSEIAIAICTPFCRS